MANAIEIRQARYVYGEGTVFRIAAIDGVDIDIEAGKVTGIIGHTGSGKSTLIQMMNGLIKPTEGTVRVEDTDIFENKKTLHEIRFKVGLVFQYPEYQLFEDTVYKDIAYGPKNMKLDDAEIDKRVREAAETVGLDEALFERSPFELSGGQKRRVAIAGIIAMKPDILVLDEPASGLDPVGREEIFGGLVRYRESGGKTVVIVSHSMEDMARYADNIIVMSHAKCLMSDTKEEIFKRADELAASGLKVPQITSLANDLRKAGVPLPEGIYTVDDAFDSLLPLLRKKEERT